jgi:adenylate cyclase
LIRREYDHAKYHHDRALSLNPNDPRIVAQRGSVLASLGQAGDGVRWIEQAFRLDPAEPEDYCLPALVVLHTASRYEEAIVAFNRISRPSYSAHAHVAACYAELHQSTEAQQHTTQVIALFPTFSTERYAKTLRLRDEADREHIRAGMLRAGLPH